MIDIPLSKNESKICYPDAYIQQRVEYMPPVITYRIFRNFSWNSKSNVDNFLLANFLLCCTLPKWIDNILPRCIHPPPPQDSTVVIYASGYHILVFALALWSNDDFTKMKRLVNTYSYCNLKLHTLANITYCNLKMKLHTLANLEMLSSTINYKVFKCFFYCTERDRGRECVQ